MEIVDTTKTVHLKLREEFLEPYRKKGDPFNSLLARSTYLTKYCRGGVETWTDTIRRVVEGNVNLAPGVTENEAQLLFHMFWTGQALPPGRGLWTGGVEGIPADARYNCFSKETRFWANNRLTTFGEAVGETVRVLCPDGIWREAEVRSFGVQALRTIRMTAPGKSKFSFEFTATSEHRWITSNRGEVTDLRVGDRVLVTPKEGPNSSSDYIEGFAHGFVFGDGTKRTLSDGVFNLRLCGDKDRVHQPLLESVSSFTSSSNPPSYNGDPILHYKTPRNFKAVPVDTESFEYQSGFLAGWLAADGSLRPSGKGGNRLSSQNLEALQWVVERAPLLGYCVTGWTVNSCMETNLGPRSSPLNQVTLVQEPVEYTVRSITDTGREEEVFCVVEPETHAFTLEGGVPTGNCWFSTLSAVDDWCWIANQLMLGGGVGVGLQSIEALPIVSQTPSRFAIWCRSDHTDIAEVKPEGPSFLNGSTPVYKVADSREGWVTALRRVLTAAYAGTDLVIDVSDIRKRGSLIKTFGGIACGPGPLTSLLRASWNIIRGAVGRKLNSIECLDITNHIGLCIKSGNVRRSALIVLGSVEDQAFRGAKKDFDAVISHRHTSNNSIVFRSLAQIENFDWGGLVEDNIHFGEPGILNLPLIWRTDPGAQGVNPCFSGDTLIAVADGRNAVPLRQLAEEGVDVPVYSVNKTTGKVEIKLGRNPRVTGHNKKLLRVWLDDGSFLDTTPDHDFLLLNGSRVKAKDLVSGMSLPRFAKRLEPAKKGSKDYYLVHCDVKDVNTDRTFEHRLISKFYNSSEWDRIKVSSAVNGYVRGGIVVHHKDFNQLNNAPDNLQLMTFRDHVQYHSNLMADGEKNGHFSGVTSKDIRAQALELTASLGRRFSNDDWRAFAKARELPQQFSSFRKNELGSILALAKACAVELGYDHPDEDPRVVRTYESMLKQGYKTRISKGAVLVEKTCETCKKPFEVTHQFREHSFCSEPCSTVYINSDPNVKARRVEGLHSTYQKRMVGVRVEQARVCSSLKFTLGRYPTRKEWSLACKSEGVPFRIGPTLKFGFRNFDDVLEAGDSYNHKVRSVEELPQEHTVYNITVDDFHTVGIITNTRIKRGNPEYFGVFTFNCGEVPLHNREACNLAEIFPSKFNGSTEPSLIFRLVTRYSLRQRLPELQDPESDRIRRQNMRVGVGLGGLCDFSWDAETLAKWFGLVRHEADSYADELGVNRPIAVTTVKPSGTISLLNGSSPGIHAPHAPYYIRRTRIAKNDPMAMAMMEAGVPFNEDVYDTKGNTWVFEFPTKAAHTNSSSKTETVRDQFQRQATVQEWWADNAVSATLNFTPDTEREELASCLKEFVPRLKSTSCLPRTHGYKQPPYEEIDELTYHRMSALIDNNHPLVHGGDIEVDECQSGACPIR